MEEVEDGGSAALPALASLHRRKPQLLPQPPFALVLFRLCACATTSINTY